MAYYTRHWQLDARGIGTVLASDGNRTVVSLWLAKQSLYAARDNKNRARWARVTSAMSSDHVNHAVVDIVWTVRWTAGADDI